MGVVDTGYQTWCTGRPTIGSTMHNKAQETSTRATHAKPATKAKHRQAHRLAKQDSDTQLDYYDDIAVSELDKQHKDGRVS